jgi:hypothetical protein
MEAPPSPPHPSEEVHGASGHDRARAIDVETRVMSGWLASLSDI